MTDFPEDDVNDEIFAAVDKIVEEYNNSKQVRDRTATWMVLIRLVFRGVGPVHFTSFIFWLLQILVFSECKYINY